MDPLDAWTILAALLGRTGLVPSVAMLPLGSAVMSWGTYLATTPRQYASDATLHWSWTRIGSGLILLALGTWLLLTGVAATFFAVLLAVCPICS